MKHIDTTTQAQRDAAQTLRFEGNAYTLADDGTTLMAAPVLADGLTIDWDALAEVDVVSFDAEHLPDEHPDYWATDFPSRADPFAADRDKFARIDAAEVLMAYADGIDTWEAEWCGPGTAARIRDARADAADLLASVGVAR